MSPKDPTFTQRHAESISRLKLILIVVCLIAIPVSFFLNQQDVGSVNNRVTKIESPCQRYGSESQVCQRAFEVAVHSITHRIACYIDHESGRPFKPSCLGVHLRIDLPTPPGAGGTSRARGMTAAGPNGGDASTPSKGHSQTGLHGSGGTGATKVGGHGHGGNKSPEKLPPNPGGSERSTSSQSSSTTIERSESTVVEKTPEAEGSPEAKGLAGAVEEVGHTVEGAGEVVGGTVEHVEGTTCSLVKVLCHE